MKKIPYKYIFLFFALITLYFFTFNPSSAFAVSGFDPTSGDIRDQLDVVGDVMGANLEVNNTAYFKICEIRRFFCGTPSVVITAGAIFWLGLMIIMGKARWTHAMVIVIGLTIFNSAGKIATQLTTPPPSLGVMYACFCYDASAFNGDKNFFNKVINFIDSYR
jgi:hypothetical protein